MDESNNLESSLPGFFSLVIILAANYSKSEVI
jgi:hypothetical protein